MLNTLICMFILTLIAAGAYYAAHQWVSLKHNRDIVADELKRAMVHIDDLEARIALMEADKSLRDFKTEPQQSATGWDNFDVRR